MERQLPSPIEGMSWEEVQRLIMWIADKLRGSLEPRVRLERSPEVEQLVRDRYDLLCRHANLNLPEAQLEPLYQGVVDELLGFGPIEPLLNDETVTEVMINGPRQVYVERGGKVVLADVVFVDDAHVLHVIKKII